MGYDEVIRAWATLQLDARQVEHTTVERVMWYLDHRGGCTIQHDFDSGEYCECDSVEPYVVAWVYFRRPEARGPASSLEMRFLDFDHFLEGIVTCATS